MTARTSRKSRNASTADQIPPAATRPYVGRFAPTPSGPLHYGSIVAALGSFLEARHAGGRWLLRIDDIDLPRVRAGAEDGIVAALECLGLRWDGPILRQSTRHAAYQQALGQLRATGRIYACACRRREVTGRPYPGTCRDRGLAEGPGRALRLRVDPGSVPIADGIQGTRETDVSRSSGDFIVRRADGILAYHLAAVVDDQWQAVSHVVRGVDLLDSAAVQCCVYRALDLAPPDYCHLPMAVDGAGRKISKSLGAENALLAAHPARLLVSVLAFLGQRPDPLLARAGVREVLDWAVAHWQRANVPRLPGIAPVFVS